MNKYAHLLETGPNFGRLLNRVLNHGAGEQTIRTIVDTALEKGEIRSHEHAILTERLADRFGRRIEQKPEQAAVDTEENGKTKRSKRDHYNGTEGLVRPRVMESHSIPNIKGTGPLGPKDLRRVSLPAITIEATNPHLGATFGARIRIRR